MMTVSRCGASHVTALTGHVAGPSTVRPYRVTARHPSAAGPRGSPAGTFGNVVFDAADGLGLGDGERVAWRSLGSHAVQATSASAENRAALTTVARMHTSLRRCQVIRGSVGQSSLDSAVDEEAAERPAQALAVGGHAG